jgi:hypothetical protein
MDQMIDHSTIEGTSIERAGELRRRRPTSRTWLVVERQHGIQQGVTNRGDGDHQPRQCHADRHDTRRWLGRAHVSLRALHPGLASPRQVICGIGTERETRRPTYSAKIVNGDLFKRGLIAERLDAK